MAKIIKIGKTQTEVRITHAERSLKYFIENILMVTVKIPPWLEKILDDYRDNPKTFLGMASRYPYKEDKE